MRMLTNLPLLNFFGGLVKYFDELLNWPPTPQTDQGELIWVAFTLAVSMGLMVILGQWWSR
jgi:hypothetical protein